MQEHTRRRITFWTAGALALLTFFGANAAHAQENEELVLDREFTIGPRIGVGYITDGAEVHTAALEVGVEMRKELGRSILRASVYVAWAGSDVSGVALDVGPGFYLTNGRVAPWLGVDVGIRLGFGNEPGSEMPVGFGGYLSGGIVFRRHRSTRVHLGFQGGGAYVSIQPNSVAGQWGVPNPSRSSFILGQASFTAAVGF